MSTDRERDGERMVVTLLVLGVGELSDREKHNRLNPLRIGSGPIMFIRPVDMTLLRPFVFTDHIDFNH